jgi:hypothetical protein
LANFTLPGWVRVNFVQAAVAEAAHVIQRQGEARLDNTAVFFENRPTHNSAI